MNTQKVPRIPAARFTWEKYIGKVGYSLSQVLTNPYYAGSKSCRIQPDVTVVGYCQANKIRVRNRDEGYVIMATIDGEDVWFHVTYVPEGLELDDYFNVSEKTAESQTGGVADFLRVV